MGKKKKKGKQKDKKLNKQLKALTKQLKASQKKEAALVSAVEQLTKEVEGLQKQISDLSVAEKEPKSTRRATPPRGKKGAVKTKVASTKQSRKSTPKAKKSKAVPASPAPSDGAEPNKVIRETPPKRKKARRRGRPRTKPVVEGDNLTAIKGLGASIDKLLRAAGVTTYRDLAKLAPSEFREILQGAGPRYKNKDPQPWIDAAAKLAM